MAYPTTSDTFNDPVATDPLNSPSHSALHQAVNTAVEALETKVGINGSADNTSMDFKLSEITGGDKAVGKTATQTLTNKTLTSPTINTPKINENVSMTATSTELNVLDGITASTAELNILDGVTSSTAELNILDGVTATHDQINGINSGWFPAGETWTYASATTITVPGDLREKYSPGDKIRISQTTTKYFSIVDVTYSSPNTTLTVTAGTTYTLANAAISSPFHAKGATAPGFPSTFSWTPTTTGFSSDPTSSTYKFKILDNATMLVDVQQGGDGTSNAATFRLTTPFTFGVSGIAIGLWLFGRDNSATLTTPGSVNIILSGSDTLYRIDKAINATEAWTGSNSKRVRFTLVHFYR